MGIRPQALLAAMCGGYGVMNLVPWGGPTMRAASVSGMDVGELYNFILPGVACLVLLAFIIAIVVAFIEKKMVLPCRQQKLLLIFRKSRRQEARKREFIILIFC